MESNIYTIDATNKPLGRLAAEAAHFLMGKNRPGYTPNKDFSCVVNVTNFSKVKFTGGKQTQKLYWRHSGYTGNIKKLRLEEMMQKSPAKVLQLAVKRMLPDNKLRTKRMKRLKISL